MRTAVSLVALCTLFWLPIAVTTARADTSVAWPQLGLSESVHLLGDGQESEYSIPVPTGVRALQLSGRIGEAAHTSGATIDALDSAGTLLGSVAVPPQSSQRAFTVPLAGARVTDGQAKVTFVLRNGASANDDVCGPLPEATLSALQTTFSGVTPNPTTVADFVPGYVEQVVIWTGSQPSAAAQDTALGLVADLTHLFQPMPVRIEVSTASTPPAIAGNGRLIEIREGGEPSLTVDDPGTAAAALVISGTGDSLRQQADLFVDQRVRLAQNGSAAVLSGGGQVIPNRPVLSFDQLQMTGNASVRGESTIYNGFDPGAFGMGTITSADVELRARYTPVTTGTATLVVRAGQRILASARLGESGNLETSFTIPAEAIGSQVGLAYEIRYVPAQQCAPLADVMTFSIDPTSTVEAHAGGSSTGGFPALPTAFTPTFNVGLQSPPQLSYAAAAVNLLAQQSSVVLNPQVVDLTEAIESQTGALLVSDASRITALNPPLGVDGNGAVQISGDVKTIADLGGPLGVVEAFTDNGRGVLAITATGSGGWQHVETNLDYIRGLGSRWASLSGDVVATGDAGNTVALSVREGTPRVVADQPGNSWKIWAILTVAVALAVAGAVIAAALNRRKN